MYFHDWNYTTLDKFIRRNQIASTDAGMQHEIAVWRNSNQLAASINTIDILYDYVNPTVNSMLSNKEIRRRLKKKDNRELLNQLTGYLSLPLPTGTPTSFDQAMNKERKIRRY